MLSFLIFKLFMGLMMLFVELKIFMLIFQNLMLLISFLFIIMLLNINFYNMFSFVYMDFGVDKMSMSLMMLSFWIVSLMILTVLNCKNNYIYMFFFQFLILSISLYMFFYSLSLMKFYLFFEISILPVLLMILGWGGQMERIQAGMYMFMYTLVASLPFFSLMYMMYFDLDSLSFLYLLYSDLEMNSYYVSSFLVFVFFVKIPVYSVHLWLPKAHVEAPVFGSMILAGVMLKLGGYGLLRMMLIFLDMMLEENYHQLMLLFMLLGSINICMVCFRQVDLKMLIAYSSVVHMSFMVVGLMMGFEMMMISSVLMMIGHGLCSSGLFCLLNFNYKRIFSRSIYINKGMSQYFLNMNLFWFIFCVFNMAAPPSLNLFSEIMLIMMNLKYSIMFFFLLFILSFFSGVYSIYLYSYTQHGIPMFNVLMKNCMNFVDEYLLMILHLIPLMFIFLNLFMF